MPASFAEISDSATIYPDYYGVTIPPNIAPLNFMVKDSLATEYAVEIGDMVTGAAKDGKTDLDSLEWRRILSDAKGRDLVMHIYAHRPDGWVRFKPCTLHIAEEPIDSFLSYRLIEPGYELYRQLGLYQRNLTNFNEAVIYENNRAFEDGENHCVNCHNYQNYSTERMLFHVRAAHGGTVIVNGNEAHKVAIKHDSIISAGVYPSWHPTMPLVAFSTNQTGQVFHMQHKEKIEVLDLASDLLLYDVEENAVKHILHTKDALETFPCWAPDGRRLYYCSARRAEVSNDSTSTNFVATYDSLKYDIYSMTFDPATRTFGEPRLEVDASSQGRSTSVPRISPDGKYLLYTLGDYGQFHIWHKSADLWVKEIRDYGLEIKDEELEMNPMAKANSPEADSYHSWSSNGRWIAFASRREDAAYSRVFITYFDKNGKAHKPFLLPQRDPEHNIMLLKSYNVPELTRNAVQINNAKLKHVVLNTEAETAAYK